MNMSELESFLLKIDSQQLLRLKSFIDGEVASRQLTKYDRNIFRKHSPCPIRLFQVPDNIKYLEEDKLEELTNSFKSWSINTKRREHKQSRTRVWFIFCMIRYAAIRLGEALALNDQKDFDFIHSKVIIKGNQNREIPLPLHIATDIKRFTEDPINYNLRGKVFSMDQGFIRRKFYEQEGRCSISKDFLNPRIIRHSRAIEMLRKGVPLPVLQTILGHQSIELTSHYLNFQDDDVDNILSSFIANCSNANA